MKAVFSSFAALALVLATVAADARGQVRGTRSGSAEALDRIQKQRDAIAAGQSQPGVLSVSGLQVGARGTPTFIDAKVMQVIDKGQMLVGIEDARTGNGRYSTWVMVKCSTAGITDGKFWRGGEWKGITGSDVLEVTGTTMYRAVGGGTSTVFVIEPYRQSAADKKAEEARRRAEEAEREARRQKAEEDARKFEVVKREASRLTRELVAAPSAERERLLGTYKTSSGEEYTRALALAIAKLEKKDQKTARAALAERLTRMTADTLRDALKDDDREIRCAAALACAMKDGKQHIPDMIPLLEDAEPLVASAAHRALRSLTDQDFGPSPDASRADRATGVAAWTAWWRKKAATQARRFVGRWLIVGDKGKAASVFTLTSSFEARKSHVPSATGKWEVVNGEARITWSDGWRDILRPQKGAVAKIAFGPGTSWNDRPANTQRAIKE